MTLGSTVGLGDRGEGGACAEPDRMLSTVHEIGNVPDVPGDWETELHLYRGGNDFPATCANTKFKFEVSEALSESEIELSRVPATVVSGKVVKVAVGSSIGAGPSWIPRRYSISILVDPGGWWYSPLRNRRDAD